MHRRSRRHRHRCHRCPHPPHTPLHIHQARQAGCRRSRSLLRGCQNIRTRRSRRGHHTLHIHRGRGTSRCPGWQRGRSCTLRSRCILRFRVRRRGRFHLRHSSSCHRNRSTLQGRHNCRYPPWRLRCSCRQTRPHSLGFPAHHTRHRRRYR